MKHIKVYEQFLYEASGSESFEELHRSVYEPAKKEYIDRVTRSLEAAGIAVKKYVGSFDFKYSYFECEHAGKPFTLNFSNSGYSLRINDAGTAFTKASTLIRALQKLNEENEQTLNEGKDLDQDLARIVLQHLLANDMMNKEFDEQIYLSLNDRDQIKSQYGKRLPNILAGPTKSMLASAVLTPLIKQDVYVDGDDLVVGDKTVMTLTPKTTWKEVAKTLKLT